VEIFVDFGLFEMIVALGLAAASRTIFSRRWMAVCFLVFACAAPVALIVVAGNELVRWMAVACLVPALVNVATIATIMRRHDLAALLAQRPRARPASPAPD
jgi:hypothetical protein